MGLSRGVTVHCGTSFANDRQVKSKVHRGSSPQPRKFKLNKTRKELKEARRMRNEHVASVFFPSLPVLYSDESYSVEFSGATRPDRRERK